MAPADAVTTVPPTGAGGDATGQVVQLLTTLAGRADTGGASPATATTTTTVPDPSATPAATAAANSTMTLELNPQNLGRVTLTLRMRGGTMDVAIAVDNKDTLATLSHDRHRLEAALGATGGDLRLSYNDASGTGSAPDTSDNGRGGAAQGERATGDTGTGAEQNGRGQARRDNGTSSEMDNGGQRAATPGTLTTASDGSLYL